MNEETQSDQSVQMSDGLKLSARWPTSYVQAFACKPSAPNGREANLASLQTQVAKLKVELDNRTDVMDAQRILIEDLIRVNEYYKAHLAELVNLAAGTSPQTRDV